MEPTEGRVGVHSADENIVSLGLELVGEGHRFLFPEIPAIAHLAHCEVSPSLRLQRKFRGRVEHPHNMSASEIGVFSVAFITGKREEIVRKFPDTLHCEQLTADRRRCHRIRDHLTARPALAEDFKLPTKCLAIEMESLTGTQKHQRGGGC